MTLIAKLLVGMVALVPAGVVSPDGPGPPRPSWEVGEEWVVRATRRDRPPGDTTRGPAASTSVRWRFRVAAIETIAGRPCVRLEIVPDPPRAVGPRGIAWVDRETGVLRRAEVRLVPADPRRPVASLVETYDPRDGQGSAVLGPFAMLPLDLPAFAPPGAPKSGPGPGRSTSSYLARSPDRDGKSGDAASPPFLHRVEQTVLPADPGAWPGLGAAKDGERLVGQEVRLDGGGRDVRQLWVEGLPWPLVSESTGVRSVLLRDERDPEEQP